MVETIIESTGHEAIPISAISEANLERWLSSNPAAYSKWVASTGFTGASETHCLIPNPTGAIEHVIVGLNENAQLWTWARLAQDLPKAVYRFDSDSIRDIGGGPKLEYAVLGWAIGGYRYDRYRKEEPAGTALLEWPDGVSRVRVERMVDAVFLVRDLINTPANDLGPAELAEAAEKVADRHTAGFLQTVGDDLVSSGYPAIYAVGQGSARKPRLIDIRWGDRDAPKVTLVGKGVCFDTGGLDIKTAAGMKLMKKDMGGAAHVLGLASAIMSAELPVQLRVLVPAVENSVSEMAFRPNDVISTRKGLTVEVANTDAEGRLILADALTEAMSESPELVIDFATLTGAARVALGPDLPALFSNDDTMATEFLEKGVAVEDPLWRLPLFEPYRRLIKGKVADLNNAPDEPFAGAITAALFLEEFVDPQVSWAHIDLMAWNLKPKSGRSEGGESMGLRAAFELIESRYSG